ncbi:response regulator [Bacilliculturomica massiliensis]|uniref:response regulator n=1 Tax=Bacilliculturomica massiliensis TaxID=1917867 RepID=UPI0010300DF7|nr:response regulator [Bacilliculturomica massiliensis]
MNELEKDTASGEYPQFSPAEYEYVTLMRLLGVSVSKHLLDEHFTLIWANEFYYEFTGWSKEEYEANFHNRPDLYYKNDQKEWKELADTVTEALAGGRNGYKLLSRFRRKGGDYVWVQISTQFSDEYIGGCQVAYTVMTNVDSVVRMQKEQSVTYESLPGFVAKYRVGQDLSLDLLEGNSRFMHYFGDESGRESLLHRKNIEDNMASILENRDKLLAGEPVQFVMNVKNRYGSALWLQVNATCVEWQCGCPVYLAILIDITDVTELREIQRRLTEQAGALKDALAVAEQANRAKTDFLSRMSHEIRTPMNAIVGMTAIAAAHIEERDRVADCLEKIGYSSKHLMTLINDILDMSKIEEGKMSIAHETFNLETVAESITSIIYPQAAAKGLTFTVPLVDLRDTVLIGDELRLNQVLINLLSNALKFTPEGGAVRLEIRQLQRKKERARLRFTVSDTGIGMSEEFLKRIFVPFEQESVVTGKKFGGTGLGMPITRNLVTLMGGTITVKSAPEQGSEFMVELDFDIPEEEGELRPQSLPALESLKVLVSDDDRDSCIHASLLLKNLGIRSDWVLTGAECLEKVKSAHRIGEDYDVCFVDWKMPDLDGVQVTRQIREVTGPGTTIIIITAYDWTQIEKSAREAGADAFLAKPIFASTLYNTLLSMTGIDRASFSPWQNASLGRGALAGRRVLLAEDNELNREISVELLKMTDIEVDCAENGQEAVAKFLADGDGYDLILMDVQMPVLDGYGATEQIRKSGHPRAQSIPIIAMTADAFHEDVVRAAEAGMNGHIAKPIEPDLLYQTITDAISANSR